MTATRTLAGLLITFFVASTTANAVVIDTVPIGNAGNLPDARYGNYGTVDHNFRMGVTEISNAVYAQFLNSVAKSDPYELYHPGMGNVLRGGIVRNGPDGNYDYGVKGDAVGQGPGGTNYSYGDKPVIMVTWFDAIRFANWLHNGQGNGDTENGAYTLLGGTPTPTNGNTITRNPGAQWWLPNQDEWYKAAYYDPNAQTYYDYPTGAQMAGPNNNLPANDTGNSANFYSDHYTTKFDYPMTDVTAYGLSESPYGTLNQGGNVVEWNETLIGNGARGLRGGSWYQGIEYMSASFYEAEGPTLQNELTGFRVATVPEPSTILPSIAAVLALAVRCKRRSR